MKLTATLLGLVILLGTYFRLYHVDHRVFWDDEVIASMHILGITEGELVERAPEFREMGDLYSVIHPTGKYRPASSTIGSLASEDPQHPPLYYLLARGWAELFGNSRFTMRLLSAVIGVVAIPCMFWLCWELFASTLAAWVGCALMAVSPVGVLYSQEIREYSLWLVATVVSSAFFLRALKGSSVACWLIYALALGASFYVFPGTACVAIAHVSMILVLRLGRRDRIYGLASIAVGCLLFVPWLALILTHIDQVARGMATINHAQMSRIDAIRNLGNALRVDVLDLDGKQKLLVGALSFPILGALALAVYELRRPGREVCRALVWSLLICTIVPIVMPDLLLGGARVANTRYFIPAFVALDLALVNLVIASMNANSLRMRRVVIGLLALVTVCRVGSCYLASRSEMWWSDYNNRSIAISAAINRTDRALVLSDDYLVWAMSLSEYTRQHVRLAVSPRCYLCRSRGTSKVDLSGLSNGEQIRGVFLLGPSQKLQSEVKARLSMELKGPKYECIHIRDDCAGKLSLW